MTSTDPGTVALLLAAALERAGIDYAIGGALAYGMYSVPRATLDVDVNVFVEPQALAPVVGALRSLGIAVEVETAQRDAERNGLFVVWAGPTRIDVFTPSIEYSWDALRTRRRLTFRGLEAWFLSPEALAVFKLLFFRAKDLADLERLVGTAWPNLAVDSVRAAIVDMLGEDDPRVAAWDGIVAEMRPT